MSILDKGACLENVTIIMDETPELYHSYAEQVIPNFVNLFREYTRITSFYMKQWHEIAQQYKGIVRTPENWHDFDESDALMNKISDECKNKKMELLAEHITDKIYITRNDRYPSEFDFFNKNFKLKFIMKSVKKITIDAITEMNGYKRYRFILRPKNDKWLIDWLGYSYEEEGYLRKWTL